MSPVEAFNLGFWGTLGYTVAGIVTILGIILVVFIGFMCKEIYADFKKKVTR